MSVPFSLLDAWAPLVVAICTALLVWAWSETFARMREAEAGLSRWPRFTTTALLGASAFALSGMILLSRFLGPTASELMRENGQMIYALVLLPSIGLLLIAILTHLDRRFHWTRLLFDRDRRRIETTMTEEDKRLLVDTVNAGLDPAIEALEAIIHEMRQYATLDHESSIALTTIERETERMKRLRRLTNRHTQSSTDQVTDLQHACDETVKRLRATHDARIELQFFGTENIYPAMPSHHLNTLLWNLARLALATADEEDPVAEFFFHVDGGRLTVEVESNGVGLETLPASLASAAQDCRVVTSMYEGALRPDDPPFGNRFSVTLQNALHIDSRRPSTALLHPGRSTRIR